MQSIMALALILSLNGNWQIILDKDNTGLSQGWQQTMPQGTWTIAVPSVWEQYPQGAGYNGVAFYYRKFTAPAPDAKVGQAPGGCCVSPRPTIARRRTSTAKRWAPTMVATCRLSSTLPRPSSPARSSCSCSAWSIRRRIRTWTG